MKKITLLSLLLILSGITSLRCQIKNKDVLEHIGGSVNILTTHYSNGAIVTDEPYVATDLYYKTKNNALKAGIWGAYSVNGDFTEFDYYVSYALKGFTFALWDVYNFSPDATYNNRQAFNYIAAETGHFVEASIAYQMPKKFPLKLYYSTVVYGRDRDRLNKKNIYTSVARLEYPIINVDVFKLEAIVAGVFAWRSRSTLYSETSGITDIRLRLSKDVMLGSYKLPIYIVPLWNPQANLVHIQVGITLFSL